MSDREVRRLRKVIQQQQSLQAGTATRYPVEVRRGALAYVQARRGAGDSIKSIARQLGLRPQLLQYWQQKSRTRFRPVTVTRGAEVRCEPARVVLVTPSGMRVEGLDVAGVARLLRELS